MLVENYCNVKNQFIIRVGSYVFFQSYKTGIACLDLSTNTLYLNRNKYSRTTSKYTNRFIDEFCFGAKVVEMDNVTIDVTLKGVVSNDQ